MVVFHVDMDNTLIYSYKHDIGENKRCAEIYQEREISFMTDKTSRLLKELSKKLLIVPTTTRTREQYERIDLGLGTLPYALVCNGGVLLVDGKEEEDWYAASKELVAECEAQLQKGMELLETDEDRCFEVRFIRELFLFTKSNQPKATIERLSQKLDTSLVNVFHNGIKVYVMPRNLSKGKALQRFRQRFHTELTVAAGDSEFDISMLQCADLSLAPQALQVGKKQQGELIQIPDTELFSEGLLEYLAERY